MNEVATQDNGKVLESVILKGDISALTPVERVQYYKAVCESVGLNPLTQPLAYITLQGKATLYATKGATDQLRKIHGVSVVPGSTHTTKIEDVYIVHVDMRDKDGRTDSATGAVNITGLKGDALANAVMKAETKAKRRCTLSLCGLGMLDETELETIPAIAKTPYQPSESAQAEVAAIDAKVKEVMRPKDGPTPIHHYSEAAGGQAQANVGGERDKGTPVKSSQEGSVLPPTPPDRDTDMDILKQDYDERLQRSVNFKEAAQVREEVMASDLPNDWRDGFDYRFKQKFQMDKGRK